MSPTTTITHLQELQSVHSIPRTLNSGDGSVDNIDSSTGGRIMDEAQPPAGAFDVVPDGGAQAWTQVTICAIFLFWTNGFSTAFGVIQAAILRSAILDVDTSTISFVGSLALGCLVAFGLLWVRVMRSLGSQRACVLAAIIMGTGTVTASWSVDNLAALFVTAGALFGIGGSALYAIGNNLPPQWFSSRLGLSNGLIKAGGGVGSVVLPLAAQAAIDLYGIAWTYRIFGITMLVTAVPCALLLKERKIAPASSRIDWSLLKNVPFLLLCSAGAATTFALFVPPFFIPLFAESINLSPATGAGLVAGFGLSGTVGRLSAGYMSDKIGPLNTLVLGLFVNAVTMLAIWPVSSSLGPLVLFSVLNGIANGAYFACFPGAASTMAKPDQAVGAMTIGVTLWTPGYLVGSSIAGILIASTGAATSSSIEPYRAAIFYAGGVASVGAVLALSARLLSHKKLLKRL